MNSRRPQDVRGNHKRECSGGQLPNGSLTLWPPEALIWGS